METFELCKKLHELKPDWQGGTGCKHFIKFKAPKSRIYPEDVNRPCYDWAPEYTLEYLLDKLPKTIDGGSDDGILTLATDEIEYEEHSWGWGWRASYDTVGGRLADDLVHEAKNPLHAVLKLAIAVAELERRGIIK